MLSSVQAPTIVPGQDLASTTMIPDGQKPYSQHGGTLLLSHLPMERRRNKIQEGGVVLVRGLQAEIPAGGPMYCTPTPTSPVKLGVCPGVLS